MESSEFIKYGNVEKVKNNAKEKMLYKSCQLTGPPSHRMISLFTSGLVLKMYKYIKSIVDKKVCMIACKKYV